MTARFHAGDVVVYRGPSAGSLLYDEHLRFIGTDGARAYVSERDDDGKVRVYEVYHAALRPFVGRCICAECC